MISGQKGRTLFPTSSKCCYGGGATKWPWCGMGEHQTVFGCGSSCRRADNRAHHRGDRSCGMLRAPATRIQQPRFARGARGATGDGEGQAPSDRTTPFDGSALTQTMPPLSFPLWPRQPPRRSPPFGYSRIGRACFRADNQRRHLGGECCPITRQSLTLGWKRSSDSLLSPRHPPPPHAWDPGGGGSRSASVTM